MAPSLLNPERNAHSWKTHPTPPPLRAKNRLAFEKATPFPQLADNITQAQREQANRWQENFRNHVVAVPISQAPPNYSSLMYNERQRYWQNPIYINNQSYNINPANTQFFAVPPSQYPWWYQANPNWTYASGFSLGRLGIIGMSWLLGAWQPYYGTPPSGFVCAADFFQLPGYICPNTTPGRSPACRLTSTDRMRITPGPITVEVVEPVQSWVRDQWTGRRFRGPSTNSISTTLIITRNMSAGVTSTVTATSSG